MKPLLSFALFLLTAFCAGAKTKPFSLPAGHKAVHVLNGGKQVYVVTDKAVAVMQKDAVKEVITGVGQIHDALVSGRQLWLATGDGLKVFDREGFRPAGQYFAGKDIRAVGLDVHRRVWVASAYDGVYMQAAPDSFVQKLNVSTVYTLVCTADSSAWIGTNIGMYHVSVNDFSMIRYAEEGYSGYELPDNIVERLYKDDASNVWVLMPDNISFKSSSRYAGEIPSFGFVGEQRNSIATIVPLQRMSYLFVTGKGVVLLPSSSLKEESHEHNSEIFAAHSTRAFALTAAQLGSPEALQNSPVLFAEKSGDEIYFITAAGGWKIKEKQLMRLMLKG